MAKQAAGAVTYESLARDIKQKVFSPVYYLMGQESYFIDQLTQLIIDNALTEDERAFNLISLFGADTDIGTIVNAARSFPMGAGRMVVIVREAQNVSDMEQLIHYLQQPQPDNILVVCHKNGVLDRRKKLAAAIEKVGVLFESKKIYDNQLPAFIGGYLRSHGLTITPDAAEFLSACVGTDLHRMAGELDKLIIALNDTAKQITADHIEQHIGRSKSFNNFELQNALNERDALKANRIINYFERNQKDNPIQMTLSVLFKHYSTLMLAYYAPDRSPGGLSQWLGLSDWQVKQNIIPAMNIYSARKVMDIVSEIRRADARAKGVDNPKTAAPEILKELVFFILH